MWDNLQPYEVRGKACGREGCALKGVQNESIKTSGKTISHHDRLCCSDGSGDCICAVSQGVIACEDTRHSLKLLTAYGIKKPLVAYHKFNERAEGEKLVALLKEGKDVALITDAGTPVISDPGNVLVRLLIENGLEYTDYGSLFSYCF